MEDRQRGSGKQERLFILPPFVVGVLDFCLLNGAFFLLNWWKRGTFGLSPLYEKLLFAFWGVWLLVSLGTGKFRIPRRRRYWSGVWVIGRSGVYLAYCAAVMVVLLGWYTYSRAHVFGACLLYAGLEWALFSLGYVLFLRRGTTQDTGDILVLRRPGRTSISLMIADFVLVGVSFFLVHYYHRGGLSLLVDYEKLLLLLYGVWFGTSLVTGKFEKRAEDNFYHTLWPWLKAGFLLFLTLALAMYLFRFTHFSRTQVFGPVFVLVLFEVVLCGIYFLRKRERASDIENLEERERVLKQERLPLSTDLGRFHQVLLEPVRENLRKRVFRDQPEVFAFLDQTLDLDKIVRGEMIVRDSADILHWDVLDDYRMRLIINLHKVNDIRWINRYFLEAYNMLLPGGWLIVKAHTIDTHREWMFQKFPGALANVLYSMDFVVHRVAPKLPWVKQLYFAITKGKGRILSRAEILGRLVFCGFEIEAEKDINRRLYVVARKMLSPSLNTNPTYGPLVTLKRLGKGGEVLSLYKFRTMYPYSEFLQKYVVEKHGLLPGGKIRDDFRKTEWASFMRRLWLDEVPSLYNWLKGQVQFVGVRPLTEQYISMYPKDLQELRRRVRPGLLPPFYADLPASFEEICASERRYIEAYLKEPLRTQVRYFFKAMWNIVMKRARSG